ncbi:hypothetical protein [Kitasatospora sp. NPDC056531]|uniref:hypothetical protein n=1 Tax=Kitasatospora sp. NPDC056531 TaxID=3345856 RepID=UPI0036B2B022
MNPLTNGLHLRLEPARPAGDPERGFAAELADPAWLVGRQWQLGEHQGENATSPVRVTAALRHVPIGPITDRPSLDPRFVPAEAAIETGPEDWWTIGRRIRLGRAASQAAGPPLPAAHLFTDLTEPYAALNGRGFDGRSIVHDSVLLADPAIAAVFAEVPGPLPDTWRADELDHTTAFPTAEGTLDVPAHDGGETDWWTVDALPAAPGTGGEAQRAAVWPERFRLAGSPAPRWWQIEDHLADLGGLPPDRAHFAAALVLDIVLGHGDDWFLAPLPARAGHLLVVESLNVLDSFGQTWAVPAPGPDWSLFRVHGFDGRRLPIWPVAETPLTGDPLDVVTIGADEDAELLWAVEETVDGQAVDHGLRTTGDGPVAEDQPLGQPPTLRYVPAIDVPAAWYPYTLEERPDGRGHDRIRFLQGRLVAVASDGTPTPRTPPVSAFLLDPADPAGRAHELAPNRIPPTGIRLERRTLLARTTTGAPVLWNRRTRAPLISVPSSGLRFDAVEPVPQP